ncbi:MAG: hypothetical protein ACRD3D_11070 [Terriglobia bacterium]
MALSLLVVCSMLKAQSVDPNEKGPTASELISGSSTSIGGMLMFDTSVGWNFNPHFGVDVGIPYLFDTRPGLFANTSGRIGYVNYPYVGCTYFFGCYAATATSSRLWAGELADGYAEAHYTRTYGKYNVFTNLTGDFPTASYRRGLTTGRIQWDWFNHVDTNFHGFDPFANFGLANGRMDQHFEPRPFNTDLPFRTFGYMADFEGGLQYKVWRRFTLGASLWDVLPMGPQRIYSNLVWETPGGNNILTVGGPGRGISGPFGLFARGGAPSRTKGRVIIIPFPASGNAGTFGYLSGDPNHGRYWNQEFETVGPAYIARDNGYSATLGFSPWKNMDVELGYNHSVRYALDGAMITVGFNANALFRKLTNY